jgi:inosine-uridine nucleoside N-ribohydrolase
MPSRHGRARAALAIIAALILGACGASATPSSRPLATGEPPTARIPIIVDTDVDVSDIGALAVLLRDRRVDVRAVTIVPTGTGVTNCAAGRRVIQYVLEEFGSTTVPYACGREDRGPDGQHFPEEWRLNANEGWGLTMPPRPQTDLPEDAVTLMTRTVADSPSAPTIVALGPWTNLEDVVRADSTIGDRIAAIHAMGGAVDVPGNVIVGDLTAESGLEWNFAADPSAVSIVFGTATPISLVPLDATNDVPVPRDLADRLAEDHQAAGADLMYELLQRVPTRITGEGQQLWDELAALALVDPDLATWEDANLLADNTGRLTRHEAGRPVRVATAADPAAVEASFLEALRVGPARATPFTLAGQLTVHWDGSTCAVDITNGLKPGVVALKLENGTADPSGAVIVGVREPHTWADLLALIPTIAADGATASPPDWVVEAGGVFDEAGAGGTISSSMRVEPGTYGPVCFSGPPPDTTIHPGQPFVVAPAG